VPRIGVQRLNVDDSYTGKWSGTTTGENQNSTPRQVKGSGISQTRTQQACSGWTIKGPTIFRLAGGERICPVCPFVKGNGPAFPILLAQYHCYKLD
jgi:hypothetical protein